MAIYDIAKAYRTLVMRLLRLSGTMQCHGKVQQDGHNVVFNMNYDSIIANIMQAIWTCYDNSDENLPFLSSKGCMDGYDFAGIIDRQTDNWIMKVSVPYDKLSCHVELDLADGVTDLLEDGYDDRYEVRDGILKNIQ